MKSGLFIKDQKVLPRPIAIIQKTLLHFAACGGTENYCFSSISPQPALLILTLLILVRSRMKQLGQAKDPIKLVWDNDGPGVLL